MKRTWGLLAAVLLAACSSFDVEVLPTEVTLAVDKTSAAVGEDIEFNWEATGQFLSQIVLEFGDGMADTVLTTEGASRASARRSHSYEAAGSYNAKVTAREYALSSAEDAVEVSDSTTVEITGG